MKIYRLLLPFFLFPLLYGALYGFSTAPNKTQETTPSKKFFVLGNGMKVYLEQSRKLPLVHMSFAVNVGSRNDTPSSSGISHLLEHLILLGSTKQLSGKDIIENQLKRYGFYFNAHTLPDVTTLELSAHRSFWKEGLALLETKLFHLAFTDEELKREKEVIDKELKTVLDKPEQYGLQQMFKKIFHNHPYQLPVGGEPEIIRDLTKEQLMAHYKTYFSADNCALAIVGDFELDPVEAAIRSRFENYSAAKSNLPKISEAPPIQTKTEFNHQMDIKQSHLFIAYSAPSKYSDERNRVSIDVLSQILSRGISPLLYYSINAKRRLVHRIRMIYNSLEFGGVVIVHAILDKRNLQLVKKKIIRFFRDLKKFRFSKSDYPSSQWQHVRDYLKIAQTIMRFSYNAFLEQGINLSRSYAKYILRFDNKRRSDYNAILKSIRSADIKKSASKYFTGKHYVALSITPAKKKKEKR